MTSDHIEDHIMFITLSVLGLYKKNPVLLPGWRDISYRQAKDCHDFAYTCSFWRAVDPYIQKKGYFPHGAAITPGLHALGPKIKPYNDVMSRYRTCVQAWKGEQPQPILAHNALLHHTFCLQSFYTALRHHSRANVGRSRTSWGRCICPLGSLSQRMEKFPPRYSQFNC